MQKDFEIKNGFVVATAPDQGNVVVYVVAADADKRLVLEKLPMDSFDLESAIDPDEVSHIDSDVERTFIVWKQPQNVAFDVQDQRLRFDVCSVGVVWTAEQIAFISQTENISFPGKEFHNIQSLTGVLIRFLQSTIRHYLEHLKGIKQITAELQTKINQSMENKYLLQMFSLSESLTYYINAIEANELVLTKLQALGRKVGFTEDQMDMLDDAILDNKQCSRQAEIYSMVLSGLMDARGSIINNNVNTLLKDLTIINIIFLPLNLIAGIGGMSEFSAFTKHLDWRISYSLFTLGMVALGWATWVFLTRILKKIIFLEHLMRPIFVSFIAVMVSVGNLVAGSLPRVGDTIDVAERDYFRLFPVVPNFQQAVVRPSEYSGGEITFVYGDPPKTESAFYEGDRYNELGHYLDKFEAVQRGKETVDWILLGALVLPLFTKQELGSRVVVQAVNGWQISGRLFHVGSNSMVLTPPKKTFDWRDENSYTVVRADEIKRVKIKGVGVWKGLGYGSLFGIGAGGIFGGWIALTSTGWDRLNGVAIGVYLAGIGIISGLSIGLASPPKTYKVHGSAETLMNLHPKLLPYTETRLPPPEVSR